MSFAFSMRISGRNHHHHQHIRFSGRERGGWDRGGERCERGGEGYGGGWDRGGERCERGGEGYGGGGWDRGERGGWDRGCERGEGGYRGRDCDSDRGFGGGFRGGGCEPRPQFGGGFGGRECSPCDNGVKVADAHFGSNGDPHDSACGTRADGSAIKSNWEDQTVGTKDFLNSRGFDLKTTTDHVGGGNATFNTNASLTLDGNKQLDFSGNGGLQFNGQDMCVKDGETQGLGFGETISRKGDAYTVNRDNGYGGNIGSTIAFNQNGNQTLNISADAHNVKVGGYAADHT